TGRYPQWQSRFLRYIDTRPNGEALRKCILSGPYKPTTVLVQAVAATNDSPAIPEHTTVDTPMNMSLENKAHFEGEKEAIHLILTGLEMKYTRLLMLAKQLRKCRKLSKGYNKPEWSRFVTIVKKQHKLEEVSYHKLFDILKQYHKEVNEVHTNEEINKQELEAHYSYKAKIQEVPTADSGTNSEHWNSNTCLVETNDSNVIPDSPDMCDDDIQNDQNDVESDDERVALANLKHVDENKKIQKQLKKANTTLAQDLKDCKTILAEISKTLRESNSVRDSCLVALQNKQNEFEKYKAFNDRTYVESLEKEIDELESDKAEFSNMYGIILQECMSNDVMCSYFLSLSDLDALAELQWLYLHKVKECDCLAQKLSKLTESVSKEVHTELLKRFAKLEKHLISLEIALQKYLKAQLQDKNIAISELKKLIEKGKGKSVETKFDKPSVVRQPNAQRIPKPLVLGKLAPFSNSLERRYFSKTKSVLKTNVSEGLSKPVTAQTLPQTTRQAVRSKSIAAIWLEKVVTPLIVPTIKGFAAASAVLKPEHLKVDRHGMSEPMSYYLID
nr:hypothetical protein [Tanacetum cinerariifolium]